MRSLPAAGLVVLLACSRAPQHTPTAAQPSPPKITQFYAVPGSCAPGDEVLLCYGVADATEVTLHPQGRALAPSYSRCLTVRPERSTRYRLTATGPGGAASAEVMVVVEKQAAALAASPAPPAHLLEQLLASSQEVDRGSPVTLCYIVSGAEVVRVDPPVAELRPTSSCFTVSLEQTTTFTVTATDSRKRQESRQVTVRVR